MKLIFHSAELNIEKTMFYLYRNSTNINSRGINSRSASFLLSTGRRSSSLPMNRCLLSQLSPCFRLLLTSTLLSPSRVCHLFCTLFQQHTLFADHSHFHNYLTLSKELQINYPTSLLLLIPSPLTLLTPVQP